jgi:hypothetical protein
MAGASFEDILSQVGKFLDDHPKEVVICDFNHFHRFECAADHVGFLDIVERCVGHHMVGGLYWYMLRMQLTRIA